MSVATQRVTTENATFSDHNKSFQAFLVTFEIASNKKDIFFQNFNLNFLISVIIFSGVEQLLPKEAVYIYRHP